MRIFVQFSAALSAALFLFSSLSHATGPARVLISSPDDELAAKNQILSNIRFSKDGQTEEVIYAKISVSDPLNSCPLETLPANLNAAVDHLVGRVRDSVSKIKETQGAQCRALQSRLEATQAQIGTAIQYQFVASASVAANAGQDKINSQIQQASAVNSLLLTASDMFHRECINSMDDKVVIQKLIGQIITLGGLFMGGWQGLAIASGGQVLGNLPLFKNEIDKTLEVFQRYDEKNERGSFLCLYRQMQKVSSLMFVNESDLVIHGLDLSFESGPARTTRDSVAKIRAETPQALQDIAMLREIDQNSEDFMLQMEKPEAIEKDTTSLFHSLRRWCRKTSTSNFSALEFHPEKIRDNLAQSLTSLHSLCNDLNDFKWSARTQSEMVAQLNSSYWSLSVLKSYFHILRDEGDSPIGKIAKTWESLQYFETLKKSFDEYRDSQTGNQARLNYYRLNKNLGDLMVLGSFRSLMKENYKTFAKHRWFHSTPIHSLPYRQRALKAMLDLCQTLDPTLVKLYADDASNNSLQQQWKASCVGPKSTVCKRVLGKSDEKELLNTLSSRAYFNSLCGRGQIVSF